MIAKEKKQAIIAEYGRTPNDTGSPEVQIAILTARINDYSALLLFLLLFFEKQK